MLLLRLSFLVCLVPLVAFYISFGEEEEEGLGQMPTWVKLAI
jgi:hypothetical protein